MSSTDPLLAGDSTICEDDSLEPLVMKTRVRIDNLWSIDTVSQTFGAHVVVIANVPGAAQRPELKESVERAFKKFKFLNATSMEEVDSHIRDHKGEVEVKREVRCTFQETMELAQFPFDQQNLTIKFAVAVKSGPPVKLEPLIDKCKLNHKAFIMSNVWCLKPDLDIAVEMSDPETSTKGHVYPIMNVTMKVERYAQYYMVNVVAPMMCFVIMSFTSYFVPATDVADRLSVSLTLVLTGAAYKFVVAGMLPAIAYTTLLDNYVMWCSFFLVLVVMENGVMSMEGMEEFEINAVEVVILSFLLMNVWYGVKVLKLSRK